MTVTAIEARTVVTFKGHAQYVWSACPKEIVAYCCVTCGEDFPTRAHLAEHVKQAGDHLVGRLCSHGIEAPAKQREREPGEES